MMNVSPITEERRAFLRVIGRKGGMTRAKTFTSDFQRAARAHVSHESCVSNGRKGGIVYVQRHGVRKLVEQARQYRLQNPSDLERIVVDALATIGASKHEREGYIFPSSRVHHITGDFVFRALHRVVYADGAAWHNGKDMPAYFECANRRMRDVAYDRYLAARRWSVLRLSEQEIRAHERGTDDGAMLGRLRQFLGIKG